jgi:hypothetical protein
MKDGDDDFDLQASLERVEARNRANDEVRRARERADLLEHVFEMGLIGVWVALVVFVVLQGLL